jgi:hypothetical protein
VVTARQLHENARNAKDRVRSDFLLTPRAFFAGMLEVRECIESRC